MKNILVILFFFISYNMFAQSVKVEDIIKDDSLHQVYFKVYTDECTKSSVRYTKNNISCPIYWDKVNYYAFYINFIEGRLQIEELNISYFNFVD